MGHYEQQIEQLQVDLLSAGPHTFLDDRPSYLYVYNSWRYYQISDDGSNSHIAANTPVTSGVNFQTRASTLTSSLNIQTSPPPSQSSASPRQSTCPAGLLPATTAAGPRHVCSYPGCQGEYGLKSSLYNHVRKEHPSIKPHFCKYPNCDQFYSSGEESLLFEHVKAHIPHWDPLRIVCPCCGEVLMSYRLRHHLLNICKFTHLFLAEAKRQGNGMPQEPMFNWAPWWKLWITDQESHRKLWFYDFHCDVRVSTHVLEFIGKSKYIPGDANLPATENRCNYNEQSFPVSDRALQAKHLMRI